MPRVLLLLAVLALIAVAIRSMLAAVAELRFKALERSLGDEPLAVPEDLPEEEDFGWIHQRLVDAYAAEREGWAIDLVRRVDARLQAELPEDERMETVVLWIPEPNAFTMPGRHVYIGRRLLERARGEEVVAMLVAHEMAHHRLGHLGGTGAALLARLPEPLQAVAADLVASRWFAVNAEREAETDAVGFNLCLAAGYDARHCLAAFDLLEEVSLDYGDTEGVFGPDSAIESAVEGDAEWMVRAKEWLWERRRGYPSVRERKARLLAAYEAAEGEAADAGATRARQA